jgi:transcriptional regulator with XRE-family HTH domain
VISAATQPQSVQEQAAAQDTSTQHGQVAQVAPSAPAKSAQGEVVLATGNVEALDAVADSQAAAEPGAHASSAAIAATPIRPRPSAAAAHLMSGTKATCAMPSPELRQQNLSILLQGKGAKSALARVIGISQPYMSSIANGGKVLDQKFCRNVAQALGMPEDWFEAPRTAADIPAVALQRLVPLRGTATRTVAIPPTDTVEAQKAPTGSSVETTPEIAVAPVESGESAPAKSGTEENHVLITSASPEGPALKQKGARSEGEPPRNGPQRSESVAAAIQVDLLSQIEPQAPPATQEATPAQPTEGIAVAPIVVAPAPVMAAVAASAPQAVQRTGEITPTSAQPLIIEGGLAPITEALIKILALKDRQGALSEDKAFELLGAVRLL